jgi:hypothetical protein
LSDVLHVGNHNYDGRIENKREKPEGYCYFEVTTTLLIYDMSQRMGLLNRDVDVSLFGPITAEGPIRSRSRLFATAESRERESIRREHLDRVQQAIEAKASKQYESKTVLVVAIDDAVGFPEENDVDALDKLSRETLCSYRPAPRSPRWRWRARTFTYFIPSAEASILAGVSGLPAPNFNKPIDGKSRRSGAAYTQQTGSGLIKC